MLNELMQELSTMGTERMKKYYRSQGAVEPFFGVPSGALKPLAKKHQNNQALAEALYETGNYDAMYLAGMIADLSVMQIADFERWIEKAYFPMVSNYVVAVTLAEAAFAQEVADRWIVSGDDLKMAAGWSCYEWLLGSRKDSEFDLKKMIGLIDGVARDFAKAPLHTQKAMKGFLVAVGISYVPCHAKALEAAIQISSSISDAIHKEVAKGRLGFKRKHVRC